MLCSVKCTPDPLTVRMMACCHSMQCMHTLHTLTLCDLGGCLGWPSTVRCEIRGMVVLVQHACVWCLTGNYLAFPSSMLVLEPRMHHVRSEHPAGWYVCGFELSKFWYGHLQATSMGTCKQWQFTITAPGQRNVPRNARIAPLHAAVTCIVSDIQLVGVSY
jgi:hypothetical protein